MAQVTLYTINNCNRCVALEDMLSKNDIPHDVINGEQAIIDLGFSKAPVLKVNDEYMNFPEAYNWALKGVQDEV